MKDKDIKKIEPKAVTEIDNQFDEVVLAIRTTRDDVLRQANSKLISLYWQIGEYISKKITDAEWGDGVVVQLANYISSTAPELRGFSDKNLWRMKRFYETYRESDEKLSTLLREIGWSNNLTIVSRCKTDEERRFYIQLCISDGLTNRELNRQIDSALYERTRLNAPKLSTALREIIPETPHVFRDSYVLEFLGGSDAGENTMRRGLVDQMKKFILELGKDFLFIGQEYRIQVGNSDFRIDLLFYHRALNCLVAFELKTGKFRPEHIGQLNFYIEALDRDVKKPNENPSIGVLLCKDKDDEVVEYALSRSLSPTMVTEYQLHLPDKKLLQSKIKELEEETD